MAPLERRGRELGVDEETIQRLHTYDWVQFNKERQYRQRQVEWSPYVDWAAAQELELPVEDTAYFQMRQRIMELMSVLDETDAKLISLRFGLEGGMPLSPEETGKRLNLTPDEVVAREANALSKLRSER